MTDYCGCNIYNFVVQYRKATKGDDQVKSVGIICEYDPFHLGHERQIKIVRERDDSAAVVCLMSGNATQRGGFAVADKYTRAEAALSSGADAVLELPFPYSSGSAEFFAAASVCLLDALEIDELNFGSESGDIEELCRAAEILLDPSFEAEYVARLDKDSSCGTARAYAETYLAIAGRALTGGPNDILALNYIKAAMRSQSEIQLTTTKRVGSGFSETRLTENEFPSATAIRRALAEKDFERAFSFMPKGSAQVYRRAAEQGVFPADASRLDAAILSFFRLCEPSELEGFAEAGGGVAARLSSAARESVSIDEMLSRTATKRYTDARLRRAMLFCLLGVTPDDLRSTPSYTTLLAANRRGREFLSSRRNCGIKIVTKPADAPACRQRQLSEKLDSLFVQTLPKPLAADAFFRCSPKISESD